MKCNAMKYRYLIILYSLEAFRTINFPSDVYSPQFDVNLHEVPSLVDLYGTLRIGVSSAGSCLVLDGNSTFLGVGGGGGLGITWINQ